MQRRGAVVSTCVRYFSQDDHAANHEGTIRSTSHFVPIPQAICFTSTLTMRAKGWGERRWGRPPVRDAFPVLLSGSRCVSSSSSSQSSITSSSSSFPSSTRDIEGRAAALEKHPVASDEGSATSPRRPSTSEGKRGQRSLMSYLNEVQQSPAYLRHAPCTQYYTLSSPVVPASRAWLGMEEEEAPPSFASFLRPSPYRHRILLLDEVPGEALPVGSSSFSSSRTSTSPTHSPPLVSSSAPRGNCEEVEEKTVALSSTSGAYLLSTTSAENMDFSLPPVSVGTPLKEVDVKSRRKTSGNSSASAAHAVSSILIGLPDVRDENALQQFIDRHRTLLSSVRVVCLPEITLSTRRVLEGLFQQCFFRNTHGAASPLSSPPVGEKEEGVDVHVWCSAFGKAMLLDDHFYSTVLQSMLEEEKVKEERYAGGGVAAPHRHDKKQEKRVASPSSSALHLWLMGHLKGGSSSPQESATSLEEGKGTAQEKKENSPFRIPTSAIRVVPDEGCTFEGYRVREEEKSETDGCEGRGEVGREKMESSSSQWTRPIQAIKIMEASSTGPAVTGGAIGLSSSRSSSSSSLRPPHYRHSAVFFYDPVFQSVFVGRTVLRIPWLAPVLSHIGSFHAEEEEKGGETDELVFSKRDEKGPSQARTSGFPSLDGREENYDPPPPSITAKSVQYAATFPACQRCYPMPLFTHLQDERWGKVIRTSTNHHDHHMKNPPEESGRSVYSAAPPSDVLGVRSCWNVHTFTEALCQGMRAFPLPIDLPHREEEDEVGQRNNRVASARRVSLSRFISFLPPQRLLCAQFGEIPGDLNSVIAQLQESAKELEGVQKLFRSCSSSFSSSSSSYRRHRGMEGNQKEEKEECRALVLPTALAVLWTSTLYGFSPHEGRDRDSRTDEPFPSMSILSDKMKRDWAPLLRWCFPQYPLTVPSHPIDSSLPVPHTAVRKISDSGEKGGVGNEIPSAWGRLFECLWFSAHRLPVSLLFSSPRGSREEKSRKNHIAATTREDDRRVDKHQRMERGGNFGPEGRGSVSDSPVPGLSLPAEMCGAPGIALLNSVLCQKQLAGLCRVVSKEEIDVQVFLSMTSDEIQKVFKPTFGLKKRIEGLQEEVKKKVQEVLKSSTSSENASKVTSQRGGPVASAREGRSRPSEREEERRTGRERGRGEREGNMSREQSNQNRDAGSRSHSSYSSHHLQHKYSQNDYPTHHNNGKEREGNKGSVLNRHTTERKKEPKPRSKTPPWTTSI